MAHDMEESDGDARILNVLADGAFHSVRDILLRSGVPDVNRRIRDLRARGLPIIGRERRLPGGRRRWFFRLARPPRTDV